MLKIAVDAVPSAAGTRIWDIGAGASRVVFGADSRHTSRRRLTAAGFENTPLNGCHWVRTRRGAELFVYKNRDARAVLPIRAVTLTGSGPQGSRLEMAIVVTHMGAAGESPPRSLFQFASEERELGLPIVAVDYDDIRRSHFHDLGTSFDENDAAARARGVALLRKLHTQKALIVSSAELRQIQNWPAGKRNWNHRTAAP